MAMLMMAIFVTDEVKEPESAPSILLRNVAAKRSLAVKLRIESRPVFAVPASALCLLSCLSGLLSLATISSPTAPACRHTAPAAPAAAPDTLLRQTVAAPPQVLLPRRRARAGGGRAVRPVPAPAEGQARGAGREPDLPRGPGLSGGYAAGAGREVTAIFAPEHGFRGEAADGATIKDGRDARSGVPVRSAVRRNQKAHARNAGRRGRAGVRYPGRGRALLHLHQHAALRDGGRRRAGQAGASCSTAPTPTAATWTARCWSPRTRSFVGLDPLPIAHGLTVGELAQMMNGEKWLAGGKQCRLTVVPVATGYTHATPLRTCPCAPPPTCPPPTPWPSTPASACLRAPT